MSPSHPRLAPGLLFPALLAAAVSLLGCSSGPACAVDTDCPLGSRCASDGTCHLLGGARDAGPSSADAGPRDGATADARADATVPVDGGPDAPEPCAATPGSYPLTTVGISCTGLTAATMTLSRDATAFCTFEVSLDDWVAGTVAQTDGSRPVGGTLTLADGATPTVCTLTFSEPSGVVDVACEDGCGFSAMRTAAP